MSTFRRQIGIVDDTVAGGSDYDTLTAGAIPDATLSMPVTTAQVAGGEDQLERNTEVRGVRGMSAPLEFRANPSVSGTSIAYPSIVKKFVRLATGATDVRTGTPPAAITHKFEPIQTGDLPAVHCGVVRDDEYDKVSGLTLHEMQLQFPLAEFATLEFQMRGKYRSRVTSTPPAASFTLPRRGYLLRDAQAFIDGSPTAMTALLRAVNFTFSNQLRDAEYRQMKNRVVTPYGTPSVKRVVWWPFRHKIGEQLITGHLDFGELEPDEDLKRELAHAQKFVFEVAFEDLATTPVVSEVLRITVWNQVYTGGGPEPLTRTDDITSGYDFGAFLDANNKDITFEFVDASNVNIT